MAEIYLRHYVQEIDDLIEEGEQLEMAIAHCRHILKSFPKHIDTYRLLGKAYLESKRYGDSADIFQRVLSAIPDDFVAHVGMAIIREDEGNIDSSIWHMERSAEAKPGNPAIEQELKRLIGKRDGLEPQRVRPSRGALARMYSHGELFSYATTELKRALEEDPDRPDLQVLLANTFWVTDQRIEAAKLCSIILEKLPFCRDANRITAALLLESGKTQEANSNMRRLISLDPYFAHLRSPMDEPHSVEAGAVQIERLSWTPGQAMPTSEDDQPDWAASLGVDLHGEPETPAEEEVPTWLRPPQDLSDEEEKADEPEPIIHPFAGAEPPPGADIPDWMKEAGWVESDGTATEGPADATPDEMPGISETEEEEPIAAAEFPDWLTDISPTDLTADVATLEGDDQITSEPREDESLDWITGEPESLEPDISAGPELAPFDEPSGEVTPDLEQFIPGVDATESFEEILERASEPEPAPSEPVSDPGDAGFFEEEGLIPPGTQELPPWLEDDAPGASETIVTWLGDKSKSESAPVSEDIPSWMRGTGPLIELPDEFKVDAQPPTESEKEEAAPTLEEVPEVEGEPFPGIDDVGTPPMDEIVAKSDELSGEVEADLETELEQISEAGSEESPGWLQEIAEIEDEQLPTAMAEGEEAPAWIKDLPETEDQILTTDAPEGAPDWLSEKEDGKPSEAIEELAEKEPTPEWLDEVVGKDVPEEAEAAAIEEQPEWLMEISEAETEEKEAPAEAVEEDEEPEWLTAIEQPEDEAVEEVSEEGPPEWVKTLSDEDVAEIEVTSADEVPPEWISELLPPEELESTEPTEEEPPEWVKTGVYDRPEPEAFEAEDQVAVDEESVAGEIVAEAETPAVDQDIPISDVEQTAEAEVDEEDAPEWLVDISSTEVAESTTPKPEEPPGWLHEVEIDEIEAAITPGMEDIVKDKPEAVGDAVEDQFEPKAVWEPEFDEQDIAEEPEPDTAELEAAEKEIESRLEWLQESAQAVSPEPDAPATDEDLLEQIDEDVVAEVEPLATEDEIEQEIASALSGLEDVAIESQDVEEIVEITPPAVEEPAAEALEEEVEEAVRAIEGLGESIDVAIDDDEVSSFLEDLARTETVEATIEPSEPSTPEMNGEPPIEEVELPEDVEGGLEWLEQLATEDQVKEVISPELPVTIEEDTDAEVPDWLQEVAEHAEEFSDEEAEAEMLETLEEIEEKIEEAESEFDPSILDTIISSRSDLEKLAAEAGEDDAFEAAVEPAVLPMQEDPVVEEMAEVAEAEGPPMNMLDRARSAVQEGDIDKAVENYVNMINQKIELDAVIEDLRSAVDNTPEVPILWQTLGDALMQNGKITEAIDAYRRGMEAV